MLERLLSSGGVIGSRKLYCADDSALYSLKKFL
jgi:hypothetical protein